MLLTISSFILFTGVVAFLTWILTRFDNHGSSQGYFLAGRSLTFPLIAGSLLLTNLSTEQLVGLNGAAFTDGFCVMVWEVVSVIALVMMSWFFLPRFLKSGVATVPQYLELRFDRQTEIITNLIFLLSYVCILLPIILYTGATGIMGMLDVPSWLGDFPSTFSISNETAALWLIVWFVGTIGSIYALFGGLRTVAVSDTLNGIGLLTGGMLITGFALSYLGNGEGIFAGMTKIWLQQKDRFNSIGGANTSVPFGTVFSGIMLLHLFYWTTNQQIIQRTLGAKSLSEGQKGVLLTGTMKLLGPIYLVIPGMIAYSIFQHESVKTDQAYGLLVKTVLPAPLTGFFAAAVIGAILSSFNSVLNSACTLFSLGIYKKLISQEASEKEIVQSGKIFGWIVAVIAMLIAPLLASTTSIFDYLQKMNGMYAIPIFAVVFVGMLTKRVSSIAANTGLILGFSAIAIGYFVPPFDLVVDSMNKFHFLGIVFTWLIVTMLIMGEIWPRQTEFVQEDIKAVDMKPWKYTQPVGWVLVFVVILIYIYFADFSVLNPTKQV